MKRCVSCASSFEGASWRCPACGWEPAAVGELYRFYDPEGIDGFQPDAFDRLAAIEQGSFWFRSRTRMIAWALGQYFPHARSLLEIGCGTGFVLAGLERVYPEMRLTGADIYIGGLRHAADRAKAAEFFQFDARNIPFEDEFDVVGAFDVLEHVDRDEEVLAGMHRSLREGGGILLAVPQHPWLWSASDDYAEHKRRYTRAELTSKVARAGFTVRRVTSFITLLLPLMVASRAAERLSRRSYDPDREFQAARRLDRALERVCDAERQLIMRGIDLPAGGSLLLVANRR